MLFKFNNFNVSNKGAWSIVPVLKKLILDQCGKKSCDKIVFNKRFWHFKMSCLPHWLSSEIDGFSSLLQKHHSDNIVNLFNKTFKWNFKLNELIKYGNLKERLTANKL